MLPAVKNIDDYDILPQGKDKKTGSKAGKVTRDSNFTVLKENKHLCWMKNDNLAK